MVTVLDGVTQPFPLYPSKLRAPTRLKAKARKKVDGMGSPHGFTVGGGVDVAVIGQDKEVDIP